MKAVKRIFLTFYFLFLSTCLYGNTGVFFGAGNQVIPIKNNQIQLVYEKVDFKLTIEKDSGKYGISFIPWVNVRAKFHLKNISKDKVSLQMGFPFFDLQGFGDEKYVLKNLNFKVLSQGSEIKAKIKKGLIEKKFDPRGHFKKVFAWSDSFKPKEEKDIVVTYRMLMGVGSMNSVFRKSDLQGRKFSSIDKLMPALNYNFSYITKTAYTWAGDIKEAVFTLDCKEFYQELEKQNLMQSVKKMKLPFTRPIVWEYMYPNSAKKSKGTYRWTFYKKVPKKGLSINFIVFYLPSVPGEVSSYYKYAVSKLKKVNPKEFKSVLYSYYQNIAFKKEPSDDFSKKYFEKNNLIRVNKTIVFDKDRKNLIKIANDFEKLIKK